jgi:hypothetical protein
MERRAPALEPETFRPRATLRGLVLAADTLWVVVLCMLFQYRGASGSTFLSAAFFVALFTLCAWFYGRLAYTVGERGLTVRSLGNEQHIAFSDILGVDILPSLVGTSYAIRTRRGALQFSSLMITGHARLCSLIVSEAGLSAHIR